MSNIRRCTHPDHVDGKSCEDYAVGCHPECECCMGALAKMYSADREKDLQRLAQIVYTYECGYSIRGELEPWEEIERKLKLEHDGDCTNKCHTCFRCIAEKTMEKARRIKMFLEGEECNL